MSHTLSIAYSLNPPADTLSEQLDANKTQQTSLPDPVAIGQKAYYEELRKAVLQTKVDLGEQLTAWRDAVGKREDNKEPRLSKKGEEEEEEEEEELEEEA
ncbi:hypothetical protein C8Q80DRAFT_15556 [Daedaleopsis nitida]|nr:hypothetical protein C8Q80DRAFT_15556 [Daedaleopsis nitida]